MIGFASGNLIIAGLSLLVTDWRYLCLVVFQLIIDLLITRNLTLYSITIPAILLNVTSIVMIESPNFWANSDMDKAQ